MDDHAENVGGVQEPHSQNNTTHVLPEDTGVAGTSGDKGKCGENSGNDDDTSDLLNAWMQRLQILTLVTTFLVSIDGELFSLTALNTQIGLSMSKTARELVYSCLAGALIFHTCASVLGYVASFALIRYRIVDASDDEIKVGGMPLLRLGLAQPAQRLPRRIVLEPVRPLGWLATLLERPETPRFFSPPSRSSSRPPLTLLTRCYYTTLCLTAVGFILAVTGVLAFIWAGMRLPVGIFSTVCLGVGIGAGVWAIAT